MATAKEHAANAKDWLAKYKALPSTVTGTNFYDLALEECAAAIKALEESGDADNALTECRREIEVARRCAARVEEIVARIDSRTAEQTAAVDPPKAAGH